MTKVEVSAVPQDRSYRLDLYHEGVHIGEYERSWASEESGDLVAKVKEASDLPLDACKRSANGKVAVGFNKPAYRKEIWEYQEDQPAQESGAGWPRPHPHTETVLEEAVSA